MRTWQEWKIMPSNCWLGTCSGLLQSSGGRLSHLQNSFHGATLYILHLLPLSWERTSCWWEIPEMLWLFHFCSGSVIAFLFEGFTYMRDLQPVASRLCAPQSDTEFSLIQPASWWLLGGSCRVAAPPSLLSLASMILSIFSVLDRHFSLEKWLIALRKCCFPGERRMQCCPVHEQSPYKSYTWFKKGPFALWLLQLKTGQTLRRSSKLSDKRNCFIFAFDPYEI